MDLDTQRHHCESLLAQQPDDWALARLFLPREQRDAATALLALRHEIRRLPFASEEPGIVNVKLNWWREEIDNAARSHHPILQLLSANADTANLESEYLQEMVDAAEMEFDAGAISNEADRQLYLYRSSGVVAELFARMASGLDRQQLAIARSIGIARGQLDILQTLAHDLPRNVVKIPVSTLEENEIAPAMLGQLAGEKRAALLRSERDRLDQLRVDARTRMADVEPVPALRVIWRRLEQDYRLLPRQLEELVVTAPAQPGMLRRLWTAWRAARRPIN
ncbi:MAG: squalene/phytoene synthase family protein [Gammaproteobacteria bacterium]|nr:squalene/phytoene synthase family protein [Gammaproteobacteria bacterium]